MTSKLAALVALIKDLAIGQTIRYRERDAEISAFSDEHVFVTIALTPEEFTGEGKDRKVRDRQLEDLRGELRRQELEVERLLMDRGYLEYRREAMHRERRHYDEMRRFDYLTAAPRGRVAMPDYDMPRPDPNFVPPPERWLDPLTFKQPTQQKRG